MAALTRTIAGVDVADVEGWLTKKKQRKALNALTGAATRRWWAWPAPILFCRFCVDVLAAAGPA